MNIPDANSVDWGQVTAWGTGVVGVVGAVSATFWVAIRRVLGAAAAVPPPVEKTETRVITTDSVAYDRLAGVIDTLIDLMRQAALQRGEAGDDRRALTGALQELNEAVIETNQIVRAEITRTTVREEAQRLAREMRHQEEDDDRRRRGG